MKKIVWLLVLSLVAAQQILLTPPSGTYNSFVTATGQGFPNGDCNILGAVVKNFSCKVENSRLTANFLVQDEEFGATPGNYSIIFQFADGSSATTYFLLLPPEVVSTTPTITLMPSSGSVGTFVKITGTGFYPKARGCQVLSPVAGNYKCFIANGILNANFTAANVQPGNYSIIVKTSYNETAVAYFNLLSSPTSTIPVPVVGGLTTPQTSGTVVFENLVYFVLAVIIILIVVVLVYFFVLGKKKKAPQTL
jgi:hypothetical protein